jgi:hypothetical protein
MEATGLSCEQNLRLYAFLVQGVLLLVRELHPCRIHVLQVRLFCAGVFAIISRSDAIEFLL